MVCLGNICINTLHKGDNDDDNDDDNSHHHYHNIVCIFASFNLTDMFFDSTD